MNLENRGQTRLLAVQNQMLENRTIFNGNDKIINSMF